MKVEFEGPPTAAQMENLFFDLMIANKPTQAHRLAGSMVDYWKQATSDHNPSDYERQFQFSYWLGMRTASGMAEIGREDRRRNRKERRRAA